MFSEKLKELRTERKLTQGQLAEIVGLTQQAVAKWEKNIAYPNMDTLQELADFFGVSLDELMGRPAPNSLPGDLGGWVKNLRPEVQKIVDELVAENKFVQIPVYGRIVAGEAMTAVENIEDYVSVPMMSFHGKAENCFGLRVYGASMEPEIREGDIVIVDKEAAIDSGDVAVVLIEREDATVKKVKIEPKGITLIGYNVAVYEPHFYTAEEVENLPVQLIGKVVSLQRKL